MKLNLKALTMAFQSDGDASGWPATLIRHRSHTRERLPASTMLLSNSLSQ